MVPARWTSSNLRYGSAFRTIDTLDRDVRTRHACKLSRSDASEISDPDLVHHGHFTLCKT